MTNPSEENQTSQRGSAALDWSTPPANQSSFEDVYEEVERLSNLKLEPQDMDPERRGISTDDSDEMAPNVMNLAKMQFTGRSTAILPIFGSNELELNQWSKSQLGALIGVNWDKHFIGQSPDSIQRTVNDHLAARGGLLTKVIARRYDRGESPISDSSQGILRALVSPTYQEIPDLRLFQRMGMVIDYEQRNRMHFRAVALKPSGTNFFLAFNEPFDPVTAGLDPQGNGEVYFFGIRIGNSEVGGRALTFQAWFVKFICSNGIIIGTEDGPLLYRKHTKIEDGELDDLIDSAFVELPYRRQLILDQARLLNSVKVEEPDNEIRKWLKKRNEPQYLVKAAIQAWEHEGRPDNAFGIAQTLARVGVAARNTRDKQEEYETLAGRYMAEMARKNK